MRYMIGSGGGDNFIEPIRAAIPDVGRLMTPGNWRTPVLPYACDNGVYSAWEDGRAWDEAMHRLYVGMLNKLPADRPLWVLLPDAVADWSRTVELASLYLPMLRGRGLRVAIALQDGCSFEQVLDFSPDWVFIGGTTEWKLDNLEAACRFFQPKGISVHVGRVNSQRRIQRCMVAGVDSVDGTCLNKFRDAKLPSLTKALRQGCLQIGV